MLSITRGISYLKLIPDAQPESPLSLSSLALKLMSILASQGILLTAIFIANTTCQYSADEDNDASIM